jgi:hypothetical protein
VTIILATGMGATIFLACFHRLMADAERLETRLRKTAAPFTEVGRQADDPLIDLDYAT